jgi:hypothetical protein
MYALTITLLAFSGICATALLRRANVERLVAPIAIAATMLLLALTPEYYGPTGRPLLERVQRLAAVKPDLQKPGSVLISSGYNFELCAYLAASFTRECTSSAWQTLQAEVERGVAIGDALNHANATVIYVNPSMLGNAAMAKLAATPRAYGWREASSGSGSDGRWQVLIRASDLSESTSRH